MKPLYWTRLIGGTIYLGGAILCLYNVYKTAAQAQQVSNEVVEVKPERHVEPKTIHEKIENHSLTMGVLVAICMSIGGIIEFLPTFLVESNIPTISSVKPYTPLELEGRDIYIKEGCVGCHSQMIRTYSKEIVRYGSKSEAGEFVYDRPFLFGSKRTGPDLHRVGSKYPDLWHYKHMMNPRDISPGSVMPSYPWLVDNKVNAGRMQNKMKALIKLGVPYSDEEVKNYAVIYKDQADELAKNLGNDGIYIDYDSEMVALIAYLQRLGTDLGKQGSESAAAEGGQ